MVDGVKIIFFCFILFASIESRSQTINDSCFQNDCNGVQFPSYDYWIKGSDTLRYFLCSKRLSHYSLDNSPCYTGDVIFPRFAKNKKDFNSRELAIHLMTKYNLFEVRMFKSCKIRNLTYMSVRPQDTNESSKIEAEIKKNVKTYQRSVSVL